MASMHDDLALYVLGALEDPREFEAHLETCDRCRAELAELRGTLDVLDAGVARPQAPASLRGRTLAAIRETGTEDASPTVAAPPSADNVVSIDRARLRRARIVSIASVAALAVVVAGLGYRSLSRDGFSVDRTILLSAAAGGGASGEARIDDTDAGQIIELEVKGLPDAPAGMYYECWWVGPNDADDIQDRVSAGTFRTAGTYRMQSAANPSRFTKMGVTLEPDDGNPARTGTKVLVSEPPPGATSAPASTAPTTVATAPPTTAPATASSPASPFTAPPSTPPSP
jgi:hypothetical protein